MIRCAGAGITVAAMLASLLVVGAGAQTRDQGKLALGTTLPPLRGQFLTGREAVLPDVTRGRVALLLLGFTYNSRFTIEAWTEHFLEVFGATPGVTSIQVPIMGGLARLGRPFIDRGMRDGTPKEFHERVITVYGGAGQWKKRTGFSDKQADAAHLLLLDREGTVRWLHNGAFEPRPFEDLRRVVAQLVGPSAAVPPSR